MFEKIIGNDSAKAVLSKMLSNKTVSNTMLFQGPDGVGKSLFAKELAKELILSSDKKSENKIEHASHPDFHVYSPIGNTHSIQSMRDMIDEIYKPPYEGNAKVFIICDAEKMLESSANAILKTLEEPSLDSYIILLSSKPNMLLTTIKSRCFKVHFSSIKMDKIVSYLETVCGKSNGLSKYIAKMAAGSIGRAHLLASNPNYEATIERLLAILKERCVPTVDELNSICNELDSKVIGLEIVFSIVLMWFRDQNVSLFEGGSNLLFFQNDLSEKSYIFSLENIHYLLDKVKMGIERNLKLSHCLHNFFIEVYQDITLLEKGDL